MLLLYYGNFQSPTLLIVSTIYTLRLHVIVVRNLLTHYLFLSYPQYAVYTHILYFPWRHFWKGCFPFILINYSTFTIHSTLPRSKEPLSSPCKIRSTHWSLARLRSESVICMNTYQTVTPFSLTRGTDFRLYVKNVVVHLILLFCIIIN